MSESGLARGGTWQVLTARGGTWRRVERVFVRQKLQAARVMYFLAVLGWVLLGIGCSVALCLLFGSWMSRTMISKTCRDYGCDGGDSLLSVITG